METTACFSGIREEIIERLGVAILDETWHRNKRFASTPSYAASKHSASMAKRQLLFTFVNPSTFGEVSE